MDIQSKPRSSLSTVKSAVSSKPLGSPELVVLPAQASLLGWAPAHSGSEPLPWPKSLRNASEKSKHTAKPDPALEPRGQRLACHSDWQ